MTTTNTRKTAAAETPAPTGERTYEVDLVKSELIQHNPWQPRQVIDPDDLQDLAENIAAQGLLQPPLGRRNGDKVQLAFGHRRLEAIRLLIDKDGWAGDAVPVTLRELTDAEMVLFALTENSKRKDLTPLEEYRSYARAIEEVDGLTIQSLSEAIGVDRSTLSNNLRILLLPRVVLERVESGEMAARAAREFLVLQNEDHCHEREMKEAVDQIARMDGLDGAPDWRTKHVREQIRSAVIRFDSDWRPLEAAGEHDLSYGYGPGVSATSRAPSFDVAVFIKDCENQCHTIPRLDDKSRAWTCNVKEWRRRQTAGTREANHAAEAQGKPKFTAPDSERQHADRIVQDPVLKAVRKGGVVMETARGAVVPANTPEAEGFETTERKLTAGKNSQVSDDEKAALGTRAAKPVDIHTKPFRQVLEEQHPNNRYSGGVPAYFPDLEECVKRCTWGAGYGYDYRGSLVRLYCFNKKHFDEKKSRGAEAFKAELEERVKADDALDLELATAVSSRLSEAPGLAALLGSVMFDLVGSINLEAPAPPETRWNYLPATMVRVAEALGVSYKTDANDWTPAVDLETVDTKWAKADPETRIQVVGNLLAWAVRHERKDSDLVQAFAKGVGAAPVSENGQKPAAAGGTTTKRRSRRGVEAPKEGPKAS